jgi:hypothetical protein
VWRSLCTGGQPSARRPGQQWSARSAARTNDLGSSRAETGWQRRRDGCLSMASFRQVVGWWQLHRQQPLAVGSPRLGCRSSARRVRAAWSCAAAAGRAQANGRPRRRAGVMTHTSSNRLVAASARETAAGLADSRPRTQPDFRPAGATRCHSLLLAGLAILDPDLQEWPFLLVTA